MRVILVYSLFLSFSLNCFGQLLNQKSTLVLSINGNQHVPSGNTQIDYKELMLINKSFSDSKYKHILLMDEGDEKKFKQETKSSVNLDENLNKYRALGRNDYHEKVKALVLENLKKARANNQEVVLNFLGHGENKEVMSDNSVYEAGDNGSHSYKIENACVGFASSFVDDGKKNFNDRYKGACITYKEFANIIKQAGYGNNDSPVVKIISTPCKGGGAAYITRTLNNVCGGWFADEQSDHSYMFNNGPKLYTRISQSRTPNFLRNSYDYSRMSIAEAINQQNIDFSFSSNGGTSSSDYMNYVLKSKGIHTPKNIEEFEKEFLKSYKNEINEMELEKQSKDFCQSTNAYAQTELKVALWVKESILQNMLYSDYLQKDLKDYYLKNINKAISDNNYKSAEYKNSIKKFFEHATFFKTYLGKSDIVSKKIMEKYNNLVACESSPL